MSLDYGCLEKDNLFSGSSLNDFSMCCSNRRPRIVESGSIASAWLREAFV